MVWTKKWPNMCRCRCACRPGGHEKVRHGLEPIFPITASLAPGGREGGFAPLGIVSVFRIRSFQGNGCLHCRQMPLHGSAPLVVPYVCR